MNGYFLTDQGQVRNHNEDAGGVYKNDAGQLLAVVADGMGGHRAGDVASNLATTHLHTMWQHAEAFQTPEESEAWISTAIETINTEMMEYAQKHEECQGMGTTIVLALCAQDFVTVAHIGDSRCYFANEDGFKQLTEDHSLVNELVRTGQISAEEAEHHPRKNVLLKTLGTEFTFKADIQTRAFETGDRLLLCSDGLTNKVDRDELSELATFDGDWSQFCQDLIQLANNRGGEDNITLAVIHNAEQVHVKEGAE